MPTLDDLPTLNAAVAIKASELLPISSSVLQNGTSPVKRALAGVIAQGFTHVWCVNYSNASLAAEDTNDTDVVLTLSGIPANAIIDKARIVVTEAFDGLTAVNGFLGRTADPDGYIASTSLLAIAAVEDTGAEIDITNELDVVTAADQSLLLTIDPAGNGEALSDLTAGQLVVLVSMTEVADYQNLVPAT